MEIVAVIPKSVSKRLWRRDRSRALIRGVGFVFFLATIVHIFAVQSAAQNLTVVEYYSAGLNHYFVTASTQEQAFLDGGRVADFRRTGQQFFALPLGFSGAAEVCRFYSAAFNSHFYTASREECAFVRANLRDWLYERTEYSIRLPSGQSCPFGLPVYRAYNNRPGSYNHRFTTSNSTYQQMIRDGWVGEGVMMCAEPSVSSSRPAAGISSVRAIAVSPTAVTFDVDLFVVDGSGGLLTGLAPSAFTISSFTASDGLPRNFSRVNVTPVTTPAAGPYSAYLMLDQSGSITSTDPQNLRIQASKIFMGALGVGDRVVLGAFASGTSRRINFEITRYGSFTFDGRSYFSTLDALSNAVGGGTPLYKATAEAITYTAGNAPTSNRAAIVFTDGDDTDGGWTISQLVNLAKTNNTKVFTVGLGSGTDTAVLSQIASQTGGFFMQAREAGDLISLYGTLGNLLRGGASLYQTRWIMSGRNNFGSGSLTTSIRINTPQGEVWAPFYMTYP